MESLLVYMPHLKTPERFRVWFFGWWDPCKSYSISIYFSSIFLVIQLFPHICKLDTTKLTCSDTHEHEKLAEWRLIRGWKRLIKFKQVFKIALVEETDCQEKAAARVIASDQNDGIYYLRCLQLPSPHSKLLCLTSCRWCCPRCAQSDYPIVMGCLWKKLYCRSFKRSVIFFLLYYTCLIVQSFSK